jgi:hypothetical protein
VARDGRGRRVCAQPTIGQPEAGALSGSGYTLTGGYWVGAAALRTLYLPLVQR